MLLVNLGTPDGTDFKPMWRYLREFLSDPRVIELPRAIWYPILYGIVLTTRPQKSGANYAAHLEPREATSRRCAPITRAQSEKLADALCRPAARSSSTGACATATRRPRARSSG